tara:strand:+ start:204 stop:398 length:195 start_codon:yes stop_codon:yes gene_type:complete
VNSLVIGNAEALGNMGGPAAKQVVPVLIKYLKDKSRDVRQLPAGALKDIGADAKITVPALIQAL